MIINLTHKESKSKYNLAQLYQIQLQIEMMMLYIFQHLHRCHSMAGFITNNKKNQNTHAKDTYTLYYIAEDILLISYLFIWICEYLICITYELQRCNLNFMRKIQMNCKLYNVSLFANCYFIDFKNTSV